MSITISKRKSVYTGKTFYYFGWGKGAGQRIASGIFTYTKPKNLTEKNHNKEAHSILESKRSQMVLEKISISSGYIPIHRIKTNFFEFYSEFVKDNATYNSRHLSSSFIQFKKFVGKDFISAKDITELLC